MPAAKVTLKAKHIKCIETETFTGADKFYLLTSGAIKPKNGNAEVYSKRVPPGGYWSLNNGNEISPDAIILALDDFEGSGTLVVEAYDQDMDQSIPDEVIDKAVESIQQGAANVASAAASTGVGLPVAGITMAAYPIASAIGSILKIVTGFDKDDKLGAHEVRFDTDRGARDEDITMYASMDGANYEITLHLDVKPYF